jgi:hypothetical protein
MLTIEIEYVLEIVNTVWATPNTIELDRVTSVIDTIFSNISWVF